jgi:hypothetical protein
MIIVNLLTLSISIFFAFFTLSSLLSAVDDAKTLALKLNAAVPATSIAATKTASNWLMFLVEDIA